MKFREAEWRAYEAERRTRELRERLDRLSADSPARETAEQLLDTFESITDNHWDYAMTVLRAHGAD